MSRRRIVYPFPLLHMSIFLFLFPAPPPERVFLRRTFASESFRAPERSRSSRPAGIVFRPKQKHKALSFSLIPLFLHLWFGLYVTIRQLKWAFPLPISLVAALGLLSSETFPLPFSTLPAFPLFIFSHPPFLFSLNRFFLLLCLAWVFFFLHLERGYQSKLWRAKKMSSGNRCFHHASFVLSDVSFHLSFCEMGCLIDCFFFLPEHVSVGPPLYGESPAPRRRQWLVLLSSPCFYHVGLIPQFFRIWAPLAPLLKLYPRAARLEYLVLKRQRSPNGRHSGRGGRSPTLPISVSEAPLFAPYVFPLLFPSYGSCNG